MIDYTLDQEDSILHIRPKSALEARDFEELARAVDPHIEQTGGLAGLIIETLEFPGWESVGAFAAHFRFVRDHHKSIRKLAVVTDSTMGKVAENLAAHFVSAEIRHFPAVQVDAAKQWVLSRT